MESLYTHVAERLRRELEAIEARTVPLLDRHSVAILRVGLGCIFLGFGLLKFFPGFSPAEDLVMRTLGVLSFGLVPDRVGIVLVAALECAIGLGLITGRFLRPSLALLGFQMVGAMSPLLFFPGELFGGPFHAPTLEGQYVLKGVVLISAGLVIGATLHGGISVSGRAHRSVTNSRNHTRSTTSKKAQRQPGDSSRSESKAKRGRE